MIVGVGVDMSDTRRIKTSIDKFGDRFLNKIFTKNEIAFCKKRVRFVESLTKMFSIKEALLKAISNTRGIFWKDMEIFHNPDGKPYVKIYNMAHKNLMDKIGDRSFNIEVSVTDEIPYVCAFVIIESF